MRLTLEIEITTDDGSSPLFEDVTIVLKRQIEYLHLSWNDPSLGRVIDAKATVLDLMRT